MDCLVTGGAGFIGSNVVELLLRRGHEVTVLDNCSTGYSANLEPYPEVNLVAGDIRDGALLDRLVAEKDAVFHLAASVGNKKSIEDPAFDTGHNVHGTINVLEAMRKNGVGTVVYSSSAGAFGEPQYQPVDETHPCEPDSPYGATKLCGEKCRTPSPSRRYCRRGWIEDTRSLPVLLAGEFSHQRPRGRATGTGARGHRAHRQAQLSERSLVSRVRPSKARPREIPGK